jgi:hypothetical protein
MATQVDTLLIDLKLSTAQFNTSLQQTANSFTRTMGGMQRTATQLAGVLRGTLAIAAVGALGAMVRGVVQAADRFDDLSEITGVTVETLSGLSHAAKLNGVDIEQLAQGLGFMSKAMVKAGEGSKDVKEKLFEVADQFAKTKDGAEKAAAAKAIFGKAGTALIPILNQGRAGLEGMWQEAERLGLVISGSTAAAAEQFNRNITRLQGVMTGWANQIMTANLPALIMLTDALVGQAGVSKAAEGAGDIFTKSFSNRILTALAVINGVAEGTARNFMLLGSAISAAMSGRAEMAALFAGEIKLFAGLEDPAVQRNIQGIVELLKAAEAAISGQGGQSGGQSGSINTGLEKTKHLFDIVNKATRDWKEDMEKIPSLLNPGEMSQAGIRAYVQALEDADFEKRFAEAGKGWRKMNAGVNDALDILSQVKFELPQITDHMQRMKDLGEGFGLAITSAFEDAIFSGQSLKQVFRSLLEDIGRMILRIFVLNTLFKFISGLFVGAGGGGINFGSTFGGVGTGSGFSVGGARAAGGPVWPGGSFTVGERGAERLDIGPGGFGMVTPLGGGGGGTTIIINAQGSEAGVERKIFRAVKAGVEIAMRGSSSQLREKAARSI